MSELEFSLFCRRVYLCAKSLYKVMWCLDVIASVSLCFYSKFCCFFGRIVCCFVLSSVFCFSVRWLCRSLACRGLIWMLCVCFLSYNVCNVISNDCDCMLSILVQWSICFWRRGIFHYLQLQWLEFHSVCLMLFAYIRAPPLVVSTGMGTEFECGGTRVSGVLPLPLCWPLTRLYMICGLGNVLLSVF